MSNIELTASWAERVALRALVTSVGEVQAAKCLQIDRLTLARALAELPLRVRTLDHIRRRLREPLASSPQLELFDGAAA